MKRYNPKDIEPRWQRQWAEEKIYQARDFDERQKFVMLTEFPYPSGAGIHLGHAREYTYGDIISRHKRMQGYNVLYPMGYDAFGLPTENFAIKNKISPQQATEQNVANFQAQLEHLGYGIDWSRRVMTSDPAFYRWTQWLFLQFFKNGLAYQDDIAINWCPHCKTGLANEEVVNGRHERCDTLVEKKQLKQWMLKITAYADRLIDGLKDVDYPSRIADQQINWIGRSNGASVIFGLDGLGSETSDDKIEVFTTAHDTIYGVTFMVIAPEHPFVQKYAMRADNSEEIEEYVAKAAHKSDLVRESEKEKTGVEIQGFYAVNPLNGAKIPIWIADYVLISYGTGAVMAVPGEDERDNEFAQKYGLPIVYTTEQQEFVSYQDIKKNRKKFRLANSGEFDDLDFEEGRRKILGKIEQLGAGKTIVQYKLRDWIFSRQHYWGEPIPIIHCPDHGAVAVPDDQLPVTLPDVDHYEPTDNGESPLSAITDWVNTTCPTCNKPAKRETDTMPNWAGSSWYYLRYFDAHNDQAFADREKLNYWGAIDLYLGGMEHTTLHLLYSRFWHEFFYDQGLVPTPEPYAARRGQGIILAADGTKMSKSKGNIVDPSDVIESGYGADALRLAIAFLAPFDQTTPWSPESVAGTFRFLQRVWTVANEVMAPQPATEATGRHEVELKRVMHRAIEKVSHDLEAMSFNTAIATLMETVNELYKLRSEISMVSDHDTWRWTITMLLQLLAPFAPHITDELWHELGHEASIHTSDWPEYDKQYLVKDHMTIVVQINGKLRTQLELPAGTDKDTVIAAAQKDAKIQTQLAGKEIRKSIYVPDKLVNFVI
jgi:leucyl-tRNA synthetase